MAELKELTVSISRKVSDDNYGSFGVQASITLEVEEGEDKDVLYAASASWLSEKIAGTHKAHGTVSSQPATPVPAGAVAKPASVAQHAQQSTPKATPQPQQSGLLDDTSKTFVVETLSVEIKGGKRYVKAKGGNFNVYGVNVWPEVLAMPPLEWDAETLDGADYPAPQGLTAIYVEKTLDSGKVVPDKVTGWA